MTVAYAGIGSRSTPEEILQLMISIGRRLAERGQILRSGNADGADQAFQIGCSQAAGKREIYLPWQGFNMLRGNDRDVFCAPTPEAFDLAAQFHPAWHKCNAIAMQLHARNSHQVLGHNLKTPAAYIVCWTPHGNGSGGTGQAIRIATGYGIPVYDLGKPEMLAAVRAELGL